MSSAQTHRRNSLNGNYECESHGIDLNDHKTNAEINVKTVIKHHIDAQSPDADHLKCSKHNILIRLFSQRTISIIVDTNGTIYDIKKQIQDVSGVPTDHISLQFGAMRMCPDDQQISKFNISNNDVLIASTVNAHRILFSSLCVLCFLFFYYITFSSALRRICQDLEF